ncbi:MAG: hypothetical protein ACXWC9_04500 [Pseudobdellovibrionaceae bacterium]
MEKFKYEKRFINEMTTAILSGLDVPEKSTAPTQRKKKFLVKLTDKKDILDRAKYKVPDLDGTTFYAIMTNEAMANSASSEDVYNFDELKIQIDMILGVLRSMTHSYQFIYRSVGVCKSNCAGA